MMLTNEDRYGMIQVHLDKADRAYRSAVILSGLPEPDYDGAADRAYRALSHAEKALLFTRDIAEDSHGHVPATVSKESLREGNFPGGTTRRIDGVQDIRPAADTPDKRPATREEVEEALSQTKSVMEQTKELLLDFEKGQEHAENPEPERDIKRSSQERSDLEGGIPEDAETDLDAPHREGANMADVQAAESKASLVQGLDKSADGNTLIEGQDIGYTEEEYVAAAIQVKYEAQQARTADGEAKSRGLVPQIGQRVSFRPHGSETKLTGNVVASDDKTVSLQCGNKVIPAIRGKGAFNEAPPLEKDLTKEFAKNQAQKLMGDKGNVFFARKEGTYKGEIIGKTPTYAIQKVNGETAILHRLKDLEAKSKDEQGLIKEGENVSIVKDENGVTVAPWNKEREKKEKIRERQKSRGGQIL